MIQCTMAPSSKFLPLSLYCDPTSNEIIIYNYRVVQWDRSWIVFQEFYTNNKKEKWTKPIDSSDVSEGGLKGGRGNKIVFQTNRPNLSPHRDVVRPQSTIHQHLHKSIVARNSNDDMQIAFFIKTPETIWKSIT